MSRRKHSRNRDNEHRTKRPDPQPHQASWTTTFLTAALAILVSAAVYAQLSSPTNMIGAMRRAEDPRFFSLDEDESPQRRADKSTWSQIEVERDAALRSHPSVGSHVALRQLLKLLLDVNQGRRGAAEVVGITRQHAAADPENLLARLAHATIIDLQWGGMSQLDDPSPSTSVPDATSPFDHFETIRGIVEAGAPAERATLYNADFTNAWHKVLRRHIDRPDVAVSLAASAPHYLTREHYAALPLIQRRLVALASQLRAKGLQEAADTCTRWIADLCLGLIDAEPDAGTRLLCIGILADAYRGQSSTDKTEEHANAAMHLEQLKADFHACAEAAPVDLCDQSMVPRPALDVSAYNAALHSLVFAGVLALVAIGAAAMCAASCLAALIKTVLPFNKTPATEQHCPIYARPAIALLPAFAVALIVIAQVTTHGKHSDAWAFTAGVAAITIGALLAVALAGVATITNDRRSRRRLVSSSLIALAVILLAALPPPTVAQAYRWLDLTVGMVWIVLLVPTVLVVVGVLLSPARLRTIAAAAALVWCLNITAAFVAYQWCHRPADERYRQTVVVGRLDEITARLGPDWQTKYLAPARRLLNR